MVTRYLNDEILVDFNRGVSLSDSNHSIISVTCSTSDTELVYDLGTLLYLYEINPTSRVMTDKFGNLVKSADYHRVLHNYEQINKIYNLSGKKIPNKTFKTDSEIINLLHTSLYKYLTDGVNLKHTLALTYEYKDLRETMI